MIVNLCSISNQINRQSSQPTTFLGQKWKSRYIVLSSFLPPNQTTISSSSLHCFKSNGQLEIELDRLDLTPASLIYLVEDNKSNTVKVTGLTPRKPEEIGNSKTGVGCIRKEESWLLSMENVEIMKVWMMEIKAVVLELGSVSTSLPSSGTMGRSGSYSSTFSAGASGRRESEGETMTSRSNTSMSIRSTINQSSPAASLGFKDSSSHAYYRPNTRSTSPLPPTPPQQFTRSPLPLDFVNVPSNRPPTRPPRSPRSPTDSLSSNENMQTGEEGTRPNRKTFNESKPLPMMNRKGSTDSSSTTGTNTSSHLLLPVRGPPPSTALPDIPPLHSISLVSVISKGGGTSSATNSTNRTSTTSNSSMGSSNQSIKRSSPLSSPTMPAPTSALPPLPPLALKNDNLPFVPTNLSEKGTSPIKSLTNLKTRGFVTPSSPPPTSALPLPPLSPPSSLSPSIRSVTPRLPPPPSLSPPTSALPSIPTLHQPPLGPLRPLPRSLERKK